MQNPQDIQTQLITISIDQKLEQAKAVEKQMKIIEKIKSAQYKWLRNGTYTFEYFSKNGWNPHIHIKTDKHMKGALIAQMLRRKLKDEPSAYQINVSSKTADIHEAYIMGDKTITKRENTDMDKMFREEYKIKDYYIIH